MPTLFTDGRAASTGYSSSCVCARAAVDTALRAGASHAELQRYGQSAKGMRIDLGVLRPPDGGVDRRRAYEVKTTSCCASH